MSEFEQIKLPIEMKNGYILIDDIVEEYVTMGGIYIPGKKDEHNRFARVIATGEGVVNNLKVGDIIVKPIGKESKINLNGKLYGCINSRFLFAKLIEKQNGTCES